MLAYSVIISLQLAIMMAKFWLVNLNTSLFWLIIKLVIAKLLTLLLSKCKDVLIGVLVHRWVSIQVVLHAQLDILRLSLHSLLVMVLLLNNQLFVKLVLPTAIHVQQILIEFHVLLALLVSTYIMVFALLYLQVAPLSMVLNVLIVYMATD